jgi:polyhydroxyalkanoate synthesis regulator phasin
MGLSDLVQKAVYLGIGVAAYAGEKAGSKLTELPAQLQKLADEFVDRGEMTTEEAKRFVDEMLQKAQQPPASPTPAPESPSPRRIPIDDDTPAAATPDPSQVASPPPATAAGSPIDPLTDMRQQVADLQAELRRLRNG